MWLKDSVFVNIYEYPILDSLWLDKDTVFIGEEVIVTIQTDDFINWIEFNNSDSILKDYPETNYCYEVQIYNQFNCLISDSICVTVLDVFCNKDSIKFVLFIIYFTYYQILFNKYIYLLIY